MRRVGLLVLLALALGACGINPTERNNRGNTLLRRGALDDALRAYQVAQVNDPDAPVPYFNAAVAYLQAAEYARAEAAFRQALRSGGGALEADIYFGLGEATYQQGKYREAIDSYQQVLLRRSDDEDARYNLQLAILSMPTETPTLTPTPTTTSTDDTQDITTTPTETSTPTPDILDENDTPTPSPQADTENATEAPTPDAEGNDNQPPPLDEEAALKLLDDVQQGQGILYASQSEVVADEAVIERDW